MANCTCKAPVFLCSVILGVSILVGVHAGKFDPQAGTEVALANNVTTYPTFMMFPSSDRTTQTPLEYTGDTGFADAAYADLLAFVRLFEREKASRIYAMDYLAQEFLKAGDPAAKDDVIQRTQTAAEGFKPPKQNAAEIYVKLMVKAQKKGAGYFVSEKQRLQGLLDSATNEDNIKSFTNRLTILEAFQDETEST
ncbi:hypothetical protein CYMTET_5618 [Cymbomonas tetramitiformis]|uniref:Endoplasmic reticulum resident protein 29 C-terminal domain-containing protein n=1 Tax=Cymbomonas tetramitiformis TaxID=36881 RepID=A0AAE0LIW4_9CHLO|nr:hypothetical protein CYMTET_5618 [Cymbomonas tetramitiformis]